MASEEVPRIALKNGTSIPAIGLGTWMSPPNKVYEAVKDAIDLGYRHIDCALVYENEQEVGTAIKEKIEGGVVTREELFIVSKLWNTFHRPEMVEQGITRSLERLDLEYLDLYLMHFPMGLQEGLDYLPTDENGQWAASNVDYVDTYKAMEDLVNKGLAKGIGISNFNKSQVERVLENCSITPVILQIEVHPYLNNAKLIEFCKSKDIAVTAYSPFASPDSPFRKPDDPVLLEDDVLKSIGEKYGKSVAQVSLRWILQKGLIVIPKSVTKPRIEENFSVFNFELDDEDVYVIDELNRNFRAVGVQLAINHRYYPFNEEF